MQEKFTSSVFSFVSFAVVIVLLCILGYVERGLPTKDNILIVIVLVSIGVLNELWFKRGTYLEIKNTNELINSGYHSFRKDTLEIGKIKYITRIPQTALPFVGPSLMLIYSRRPDGVIAHSTVREYSYDESTLKRFLARLKEINPAIELDPEYEEFLREERLLRTKTNNTAKSVEQMLRGKGEKW